MNPLHQLKDELNDCSAVSNTWIETNNTEQPELHVTVTGQTHGKVSTIIQRYKDEYGISQIDTDDTVYSGEKRHYVFIHKK